MVAFRNAQTKLINNGIEHLFVKGELGHAAFADIGSGKTLAALEIFSQLRDLGEAKRCLLIAPVRPLTRTWPDEIKKWGYNFTYQKVNGKALTPACKADIILCSPDSLHKVEEMVKAGCIDFMLVDESQRFQSFTNLRWRRMKKLLPHIKKRMILTATPRANKMTQLFSQIYICDDGERLGKNATIARARYTDKGGFKGKQFIFDDSKDAEVTALISPIVTRIGIEDIDFDYPELVTNDLICPIDADTAAKQRTLKDQLYIALREGETLTMSNAGAAYNSLKQLANGFVYGKDKTIEHIHNSKLDALESIANESSGQVLIFYWFAADLERIVKKLGATNCAVPAGKGDKLANKEIDKWMAHEKQFMPAQIVSMGEGLNLQAPDHATIVMMGVPDSATPYIQGIGRLKRPGGAKHIFNHRLLLEDSIDLVMVERLDGRIDGQDAFLNSLKDWASK